MKLIYSETAWEDYLHWQSTDKKILKRINTLIKDITGKPFDGLGKPESLKHALPGHWSCRVNDMQRMVYKVTEDAIYIEQLRYHYYIFAYRF